MREEVLIELLADWQDIDIIYEDDMTIEGVWATDDRFVPLNETIRYGTPWIGEAPDFINKQGEHININGVFTDFCQSYYLEASGYGEIRVWQRVVA